LLNSHDCCFSVVRVVGRVVVLVLQLLVCVCASPQAAAGCLPHAPVPAAGGNMQLQSTMDKMKSMAVKRESMRQQSFKAAADMSGQPPAAAATAGGAAAPGPATVKEEEEEEAAGMGRAAVGAAAAAVAGDGQQRVQLQAQLERASSSSWHSCKLSSCCCSNSSSSNCQLVPLLLATPCLQSSSTNSSNRGGGSGMAHVCFLLPWHLWQQHQRAVAAAGSSMLALFEMDQMGLAVMQLGQVDNRNDCRGNNPTGFYSTMQAIVAHARIQP